MTHPISPLESLIGMTITDVEIAHDYIRLHFGTGTRMSIYNNWSFVPKSTALPKLIGRHVAAVHSNANEVVLLFDNGARLIVDLTVIAWKGPEAMQLDRVGLPTVVWN